MKPAARHIFNVVAAISLALCVLITLEEAARFPDNDFSIYWASHGTMISIDTFENTPTGNAITIRRLRNIPSDVSLHFQICSMEAGTEVPTMRGGNAFSIWLDRNNQPIEKHQPGHSFGPVAVSILAQIQLTHVGSSFLLAALTPILFCLMKYRAFRTRRMRKDRGLCLSCGYDLRGTPERCPECGAVPMRTATWE